MLAHDCPTNSDGTLLIRGNNNPFPNLSTSRAPTLTEPVTPVKSDTGSYHDTTKEISRTHALITIATCFPLFPYTLRLELHTETY